jgi:dihydrofolate reductase
MGRKTWESLPPKVAPLPGRLNVVLSRVLSAATASNDPAPAAALAALPPSVLVQPSLHDALRLLASAEHAESIDTVYVIGGAQVLTHASHTQLTPRPSPRPFTPFTPAAESGPTYSAQSE